MKKDLFLTFISQAIIFLGLFACYKLALLVLGGSGFSEYLISRRFVAMIQPLAMLGLGIGIPRYISCETASNNSRNPDIYFISGLLIVLAVSAAIIAASYAMNPYLAALLFGSSKYAGLSIPIALVLVGNTLTALCYAFYRGKILFFQANALALVNFAAVPVLSFFFNKNLAGVLMFNGTTTILLSAVFVILIFRRIKLDLADLSSSSKKLIYFGMQRVPGEFAMGALLSLPVFIALHRVGMEKAGYIAFGVSAINAIGQLLSPVGLVLLPVASKLLAGGEKILLRKYVRRAVFASFCISSFLLAGFLLFGSSALQLYMGSNIPDLFVAVLIALISGFGYSVYTSLRSFIDALSVNAVNTANIFICLAVFTAFSVFARSYLLILANFAFSLSLLGVLSVVSVSRLAKDNK